MERRDVEVALALTVVLAAVAAVAFEVSLVLAEDIP